MLELSKTKEVQFAGDENGFIKVDLINKRNANGHISAAYAKIESSYCFPALVVWNNKFDTGITYNAGTKSFLFADGTTAYTHA